MTARFDAPIIEYAAAHRVAGLTSVMKALTTAGNPLYLAITVLIGGAILAWITRSWKPLLVLALVMFGAVSLDQLYQAGGSPNSTSFAVLGSLGKRFVFPFRSRYSIAAVYLTLAICFMHSGEIGVRTMTYSIGIAAPILIGISRVYLAGC